MLFDRTAGKGRAGMCSVSSRGRVGIRVMWNVGFRGGALSCDSVSRGLQKMHMGGFDHGADIFERDGGRDVAARHEEVSGAWTREPDAFAAGGGDALGRLLLHDGDGIHVAGEGDLAAELSAHFGQRDFVIDRHDLRAGGGDRIQAVGGVAADVDEDPDATRLDAGGDAGLVGLGELDELLARDEVAGGGGIGEGDERDAGVDERFEVGEAELVCRGR